MIPAALEHNKFIYNIRSSSAELNVNGCWWLFFFQVKQTNKPILKQNVRKPRGRGGGWIERRRKAALDVTAWGRGSPGLSLGVGGWLFTSPKPEVYGWGRVFLWWAALISVTEKLFCSRAPSLGSRRIPADDEVWRGGCWYYHNSNNS